MFLNIFRRFFHVSLWLLDVGNDDVGDSGVESLCVGMVCAGGGVVCCGGGVVFIGFD